MNSVKAFHTIYSIDPTELDHIVMEVKNETIGHTCRFMYSKLTRRAIWGRM